MNSSPLSQWITADFFSSSTNGDSSSAGTTASQAKAVQNLQKPSELLVHPEVIAPTLSSEIREKLAKLVHSPNSKHVADANTKRANLSGASSNSSTGNPPTGGFQFLKPIFDQMQAELGQNRDALLSLNPSRRESLCSYLEKLSGGLPSAFTQSQPAWNSTDPSRKLHIWLEDSNLPTQREALKKYFSEVSLITISQAILLKLWSYSGSRIWCREDLGKLNWILSTTLKPFVPLDREGWQITRPNLYSWYNPSPEIQHALWKTLEAWNPPNFTSNLFSILIQTLGEDATHTQAAKKGAIASSLFRWMTENSKIPSASSQPSWFKRKRVAFTPTLGDGSWISNFSNDFEWVGLEQSPFSLMISELSALSNGPIAPCSWTSGTGLEVHNKDQLALELQSAKQSLISKISEMEACDLAVVLEDKSIRTSTRNWEGLRYKEAVEKLPYFKKMKSSGTSMGVLQACVAMTKLRPGGILIWTREEALTDQEGHGSLQFLMERGKLLGEWSFETTEKDHPKLVYLWEREAAIENRLSHCPIRIFALEASHKERSPSGIEKPTARLAGALNSQKIWGALWNEESSPEGISIHRLKSPTPQKEWMERWPNPEKHSQIQAMDALKIASLPLASISTIRHTPEGDPKRNNAWHVPMETQGFWISASSNEKGRCLRIEQLPRPGREAYESGTMVLVPDQQWIAPLMSYFGSDQVRNWLDHNAERRGDRWLINEQIVKFIPVPKLLMSALGFQIGGDSSLPVLPPEWEKLSADIYHQPKAVKEALDSFSKKPEFQSEIGKIVRSVLFVRASRVLEYFTSSQQSLFQMFTTDGNVRWGEIIQCLPKSDILSLPLHPEIHLSGQLPPHVPISRIERVQQPSSGLLLMTESGLNLHLGIFNPRLSDLVFEQMNAVKGATWAEIVQNVRVPRNLEAADGMASEILKTYQREAMRRRELTELVSKCLML